MSKDYFNPPNSIWPNGLKRDEEGYVIFYPLGTNKVDISTITWPEGDTLISPFVYQNDKLVGFVDTKALTVSELTTIYLPYTHIEAEFSAIEKGQLQIHAPNATTKKVSWMNSGVEDIAEVQFKYKGCKNVDDVKAVDAGYKTTDIVNGAWSEPLWDLTNGKNMFNNCTNLTSFSSDLSNLTEGFYMFGSCTNLTSFSSDLSSLTNGGSMFRACSNLTSFTSDLSSLTNGNNMFYMCSNLTSFTADLPSLTYGTEMFRDCINLTSFSSDSSGSPVNLSSLKGGGSMFYRCSNLTSFSSDLRSLTDGNSMFWACKNLTSFNSDLSKLTNGQSMFNYCSNLESFSSNLSSLTKGKYMFSDCSNLTSFSSDLRSLTDGSYMFSECKLDAPSVKNIIGTINTVSGVSLSIGMGCDNTTEDKKLFAQEAGYPDGMSSLLAALKAKGWTVTAQYNGRPTTTYGLRRPSTDVLPIFAQLEEVEDHADYTSADGSKKYRLNWFHETTGSTEGYTQFNSIEEAVEHFNIKPIER